METPPPLLAAHTAEAEGVDAARRYAAFVQGRLEGELAERKATLRELRTKRETYLRIESTLLGIEKAGVGELDTRVDIGAGCSVAAHVPSLATVLVNVGLGFHVEMRVPEARAWAAAAAAALDDPITDAARDVANTAAHIRVALASIRELLPRHAFYPDPNA